MIDLSSEFRNEMYKDNRNFLPYLIITLKDGTELNLTKKDVWQNSLSIEDATSASGTFTIGAAVTGKAKVTLNNIYNDFSEYDFADANVIIYIGMQLSKALEKVRIGTYIVDEPSYDGSTITLSCLDYLTKFDRPYSESMLIYPASITRIIQDACNCCGVSLASADIPNANYQVETRPADDALTFGDIIAMAAQIAGCFAKMDAYGRLKLNWYDMSVFEKNANLDGGRFDGAIPHSTGDVADGGNFMDYSSGDTADGGSFEDLKRFHHIFSIKSLSMSTDDAVITGVRVMEEYEETDAEKAGMYLAGSEGYVAEISGNCLIQKGRAEAIAKYLYGMVGGMQFRPLDIECLADPSIEAGDIAYVTDRKRNSYRIFISTRTFNLGGSEKVVCDAETPLKNSATHYSNAAKAVVKARNETQKAISSYDLAVQQLTNLITQSFGVFKTEEVLEDGSTIFYLHNKPELSTSSAIWKMTANAFAVSTDGGKTWNAGMDSSGNAVVNVLNAIGINADWINTGTFIAQKDGKAVFLVDVDTGRVNIVADSFSLSSGATIDSIAQEKVNALDNELNSTQEIFNRLTQNGALQGVYLENNQLYINASYIRSGSLSIGGQTQNADGMIEIFDKDGAQIGLLNKDGIDLSGSFHSNGSWTNEETGEAENFTVSMESGSLRIITDSGRYLGIRASGGVPELALGDSGGPGTTISNAYINTRYLTISDWIKADTINANTASLNDLTVKTMSLSGKMTGYNGSTIMEIAESPVSGYLARFPNIAEFSKIRISGFAKETWKFNCNNDDLSLGANGTVVYSGGFICMYGTIQIFAGISAGSSRTINIGNIENDLVNPEPIPDTLLPNHKAVKGVTSLGGKILTVSLSTSGTLTVRNCSSTDISAPAGETGFRLDYTTI